MEPHAGIDSLRPTPVRLLQPLFISGILLQIIGCAPSQAERYRVHLTTLLPAHSIEQSEVAIVAPSAAEHNIVAVSESVDP